MTLQYRIQAFFLLCIISISGYSQVGVGTTNPTAELEIATTNTGIPALEINPQTAPVGTVTGQLAVIGDELYMYDATRVKWLNVSATAIQFGYYGSINTNNLEFGGSMDSDIAGPLMPFNGTIVAVTATTVSNSTKSFELRVRDYNPGTGFVSTTQSYIFGLTDYEFVNSTLNLDFNQNDFLAVRGNAGGGASDPSIIIWVKWRK